MNWQEKDKANIWHPFTHQKHAPDEVVIDYAKGLYFYDEQGNAYMDAIASWWVNLHGHAHPYISEKVSVQLYTLEHAIFSGFTHKPAIELAERLLNHLPENQSKIFYSDNGSTAVEVALKMVFQYWHNQKSSRSLFVAFEGAYHGDTFGGMSVGARNVFNQAFENHLFHVAHIPLPTRENIEQIKAVLSEWLHHHDVAGFIFEPLIQGAGGMVMYNAELLDELIGFCRQHQIITIADEVMTGFGRTGKFFASDHLNNKPDILCLSKGLTGGYMPLGVTSCAQFIYDAYVSDDKSKTFFHGHSYTANPTACSAALASLDLMESEETFVQIEMISEKHVAFADEIRNHSKCKDVRTLGVVLAVELQSEDVTHYLNHAGESVASFFLKRGIILRPLGNVFYILPPYCITEQELDLIYSAIRDFLAA